MIRTFVSVAVVLALTACSQAPATESTTSASTPTVTASKAMTPSAKGKKIRGTGYTYVVPDGWGKPSQDIPGFDPDSIAVDLNDSDGFTDNVNVLPPSAGKKTLRRAEAAAKAELAAWGAQDIRVNTPARVAGSKTAHVTAGMSMNGNHYTIEQFYPTHNGRTFVVTFSFSKSLTAVERAQVTDTVLATWVWTS